MKWWNLRGFYFFGITLKSAKTSLSTYFFFFLLDFFDDKFQGIDYQIKFLMVLIISDKLFPEYLYKFIP